MRLPLIVLAVLAATGAGYYFWSADRAGGFEVETVAVERGDVRRAVSTTGTVVALVTVEIGSQLSGNISELNADFSSEVKSGEVLARIEPSTFEMKVREERSAVSIAKANLSLQEASVKKAEATLVKADIDLDRARKLVERGASSQAALDAAQAAQVGAEADVAIAKANVENARATVEQKQATLESAEVDLARTYIRSPIEGVVIERAVEVGQTVAASFSAPKLFTIAQDLSRVEIQAQVDEADIGQVKPGDQVSFTVDAYPDETFAGKVEQIRLAPTDLENVVTYTVIIAADNEDGRLLPGMTANVAIVTGENRDVVVVPNQALRFEPRGAALTLVAGAETGSGGGVAAENEALLRQLKTDLSLPDERIERIRQALAAEFDRPVQEGAGGIGPPARVDPTERNMLRRNNVLRGQLNADEFQRYETAQFRAAGRRGTVWTYEDGKLVSHQVKLGLSDAAGTEVLDGLEAGSKVVVRVGERTE